tara:strand:+ start:181 stop:714 length:534 start_codon:yes stop_codon:yes gene_type:complete
MYTEEKPEETIESLMNRLKNKTVNHNKWKDYNKSILKNEIKLLLKRRNDLFNDIQLIATSVEMFKVQVDESPGMTYLDFVISAAATIFGTTVEDISSTSRKQEIINARQYIYSEVKSKDTSINLTTMGKMFNGVDFCHATVINSLKQHDRLHASDTLYRLKCGRCDQIIGKFLTKNK